MLWPSGGGSAPRATQWPCGSRRRTTDISPLSKGGRYEGQAASGKGYDVGDDVAEQRRTERAVAAAVVDLQRVTAERRQRDCVHLPGVDVVAMAGEQKLKAEDRGSSGPGIVEPLRVGLRLGLGEKFVGVLSANRAPRGGRFEAVSMQMVCELPGEFVEAIETGVEV